MENNKIEKMVVNTCYAIGESQYGLVTGINGRVCLSVCRPDSERQDYVLESQYEALERILDYYEESGEEEITYGFNIKKTFQIEGVSYAYAWQDGMYGLALKEFPFFYPVGDRQETLLLILSQFLKCEEKIDMEEKAMKRSRDLAREEKGVDTMYMGTATVIQNCNSVPDLKYRNTEEALYDGKKVTINVYESPCGNIYAVIVIAD